MSPPRTPLTTRCDSFESEEKSEGNGEMYIVLTVPSAVKFLFASRRHVCWQMAVPLRPACLSCSDGAGLGWEAALSLTTKQRRRSRSGHMSGTAARVSEDELVELNRAESHSKI